MTFKEFCVTNDLNYEVARKYKYRHPELSNEQILKFYNQPLEPSFYNLCKKANVNYDAARSLKRRHPELMDEEIITYYNPRCFINILGELVIPDAE